MKAGGHIPCPSGGVSLRGPGEAVLARDTEPPVVLSGVWPGPAVS